MTTQEKTIEEIVEEFKKLADPEVPHCDGLFGKGSYSEWLKENSEKHLCSFEVYGEPMFDLDDERIADWLTKTLQAERQKQRDAIAATEIRVREEEANEYNKIIEEAVEKERERIGKVINKLRPILWSDSPETHTCNIRLTNNLNTIEKALTPTNDKHYEKSS